MEGILVIGHGSRSSDAKDIFFSIVNSLDARFPDKSVKGCFMEISSPNIEETVEIMYSEGVRSMVALPYFLFPGIHIKEDIPEILERIKAKYPDMSIAFAQPLGFDEKLVDILAHRAAEAISGK
ncbi:cobalamin (vitamin B12) biosynthesis CbiX protein CbiX (plasmid) [Peptoclostridium acidaminophilum DSM 3953]|uniref:Cobalamin (Vitamin B12) biosynthesis CbiX protein CbiX n=1 Tax=Peptoclostridium acidaminophilum DSM 3953 TaxID=1286171 RepID=W8TIA8_PEPAC|nr:CbiX/SirB N-terminal domain-containing protein [Peptoclostridium acidaminophilum]AHM57573.1 cobalamin (vitamin B12) biosynthesis CbiX protein CbiX [Peptoclostridium acidaminophilum DSM 3953]